MDSSYRRTAYGPTLKKELSKHYNNVVVVVVAYSP